MMEILSTQIDVVILRAPPQIGLAKINLLAHGNKHALIILVTGNVHTHHLYVCRMIQELFQITPALLQNLEQAPPCRHQAPVQDHAHLHHNGELRQDVVVSVFMTVAAERALHLGVEPLLLL